MICDNCGKSNATGITTCAYCGSEMPKLTDCAGFGDILTYKAPEPVIPMTGVGMSDDSGRISDVDMKNLLRKSDNIMRGTKFNLLLVGICAFMLFISIIIGVYTVSKINRIEDRIEDSLQSGYTGADKKPDTENPGGDEIPDYKSNYSENSYENLSNILTTIHDVIVSEQ